MIQVVEFQKKRNLPEPHPEGELQRLVLIDTEKAPRLTSLLPSREAVAI